MTEKNKLFYYGRLFFGIFFVDRITKIWAIKNLAFREIKVTPFLNLQLVWNKGVSWGFLSPNSKFGFIFLILSILLIISIFAIYTFFEYKQNKDIFFNILVLSGAISNLFDRFFYHKVVDFIDFFVNSWHWPAFNFADIFIVVGVLGILGRYFYHDVVRKT